MGVIYNLYITNDIKVDNDIFISTLFYHLNQLKDLTFFESLSRNGLIPLNHKLGLYLIDRATHAGIKQNKENEILFNFGIENLMEKDDDIGEVVDELMTQEKYFECFDLVSYFLCQKKYTKQDKFGYFRNFMTEGFTNFLRNDNNENEENKEEENGDNKNEK